jgi:hypothetical protein
MSDYVPAWKAKQIAAENASGLTREKGQALAERQAAAALALQPHGTSTTLDNYAAQKGSTQARVTAPAKPAAPKTAPAKPVTSKPASPPKKSTPVKVVTGNTGGLPFDPTKVEAQPLTAGGSDGSGNGNTGDSNYIASNPSVTQAAVKIATKDIIILNDTPLSSSPDIIADLAFEEIGGQEIINIARNDLVNGQNILYQPIANMNKIAMQYNSYNLSALQGTSYAFFKNFPIDIESHIPEVGNGPNGNSVYLDASGNLVIDLVNMLPDEQVEIQILNSGSRLSDTIYFG